MKARFIIILIALIVSGGLRAQYYNDYYHRVGDTIHNRSDIGYYMWWDSQTLINTGHNVVAHGDSWGSPVVLAPYFTSSPLKVVGIAGCAYARSGVGLPYVDATSVPEYFYLFDNNGNRPVFVKRVQWDNRDPHRYLELDLSAPMLTTDSCCVFQHEPQYFELKELYFDTAVTLNDTFYVGFSFHCGTTEWGPFDFPTTTGYISLYSFGSQSKPCSEIDTIFHNEFFPGDAYSGCYFPIFDYLKCDDTSIASNPANPNLQWTTVRSRMFFLVYPIIEIDTTQPPFYLCDPVQNVQVTTDSCAVVTWDDFLHYTYCNVQYYALEDGYNTALTETVSGTNMLRICGLDSTKHYFVRVNAFCDTSKIETDWSAWVPFQLGGGTEGIEGGESALSHYTYLVPNPASDRLTITSSFGITRVEVYNLSGILVYSEPAGFSNHSIDLGGWAAGQYIVMVHTPHGVTAKRLVVRR